MTPLEVINTFNEYRSILCGSPLVNDDKYEEETRRLIKAWLCYLSKEDRIIVFRCLIAGENWFQISDALVFRWGSLAKRTEHDLKKRFRKAIESIGSLMEVCLLNSSKK